MKIIKKDLQKKDTSSTLAVRSNDSADYQQLTLKKDWHRNDESVLCQLKFVASNTTNTYKLARLMDCGNDLSKRWFVVYYVLDETKGTLVRKRAEVRGNTHEVRMYRAAQLIKIIDDALLKGAVVNPKPKSPVLPLTLARGFELFLDNCLGTNSKNTHRTYKSHLMKVLTFFEPDKLMKDLTEVEVIEMLDKISAAKITNKYRNCVLNTLGAAYKFFIKRKRLKDNPTDGLDYLSTTKRGIRAYTTEQAIIISQELQAQGQLQLLFFCKCIYFLLARPHEEIRHLKIKHIHADMVEFRAEHSKGDRTEYVEIPPPLEALFEEYQVRSYPPDYYLFSHEKKPGEVLLGQKYFYKRYVKVLEKLNLKGKGYDLYSWKHTGAIAYWRATRDLEGLMKQCRHKDISQTVGYLADLGQIVTQTKINQFPDF